MLDQAVDVSLSLEIEVLKYCTIAINLLIRLKLDKLILE